jgi:hypothetical protein
MPEQQQIFTKNLYFARYLNGKNRPKTTGSGLQVPMQ